MEKQSPNATHSVHAGVLKPKLEKNGDMTFSLENVKKYASVESVPGAKEILKNAAIVHDLVAASTKISDQTLKTRFDFLK